ncbi:M23 family metallopeptidase [Streptomyces sp. NPDC051569]|uniref:M23 family metallopeptidase n=1 Tax=Streptomyces sp. NPDC051569 TaxID=3365661 RepID=UPI0037B04012
MNDQHPHAGYAAYDGYQNGSFETDPLFAGTAVGYEGTPVHGGQYDSTQWDPSAAQPAGYDLYATPRYDTSGAYDTTSGPYDNGGHQYDTSGQWDADAWNQAPQPNGVGPTAQFENTQFDNAQFDNAQFGYDGAGHAPTAQFDAGQLQTAPFAYEPTAQWVAPTFDTGAYDATAWNSGGTAADQLHTQDTMVAPVVVPEHYQPEASYETYEADALHAPDAQYGAQEHYDPQGPYTAQAPDAQDGRYGTQDGPYDAGYGDGDAGEPESANSEAADARTDQDAYGVDAARVSDPVHMAPTMTTPAVNVTPHPVRRPGGGGNGSRGRRRTPAKRSALLTVAVPSACVMGVAGIAAASVGGLTGGEESQDDTATTASAPDPASVKPIPANEKLNTQITAMSAGARDFGDRASRTQERIDLKARQEAEKQKREEEAARKEALRPKFALPVSQHGLSAFYGQAGVNWMSVHTGIDFPVQYGTPVMAATDGTVRTQWNSAYGNMAIVTSPEGTETWYCHLSSTKIRSGSVKAGEVIAYSGNSGNSTGPHLHFEVRPGGGSAIDPLPWLRSHGINPT